MTVLVAERSELYREIITRILHGFGAQSVYSTGSLDEAMRKLAVKSIDIFICGTDVEGAFDAVRKLRLDRKHPCRSIPIVFTVGAAGKRDVALAKNAGANMLLRKPISPKAMYERLAWIANSPRPFWESETFYGPDRRVSVDEAGKAKGRRKSDSDDKQTVDAFDMSAKEA